MTLEEDPDRLVVLKKAQKRLITQREAAEELRLTERHARRLLRRLKQQGDRAVLHGLRGRVSNRRLSEKQREKAIRILSREVYRGFGPTLAAEHCSWQKHGLKIGRETVRKLMSREPGSGRVAGGRWRRCMCGGSGDIHAGSWCSGTPPITTGWKAVGKVLSDLHDRRRHQRADGALCGARFYRGEPCGC